MLPVAVEGGNLEIVKVLVGAGADPKTRLPNGMSTVAQAMSWYRQKNTENYKQIADYLKGLGVTE